MADQNFRVRKGLTVGEGATTVDGTTGDIVTIGDVAVNGGDITTSAATANIVNATATTVNIAGAGTTVAIGANTGTLTIGNPTVVGTQATQNLYNTVATTLNIGGGATTAVNVGNASGEIITPSDIKITGNKSLRQGDGPYSGSTDIYRDQLAVPIEGVLISNNNMTNSNAGLVIRNYGQNITGGGTTLAGTALMHLLATRGTPASPLAINNTNTMAQITVGTNYGDTTGAGTGNGWSNDLFSSPLQPAQIDFNAIENHRQAPVAVFTGSIAGTTLTVTAVTSGTIAPGQNIRATGLTTTGIIILRQITTTAAGNAQGSTGTYQLSTAAGLASTTVTSYTVSSGVGMRIGVMPSTVAGTATSAIPNNVNVQRLTVTPSSSGGSVASPFSQLAITPGWNSFPVAQRVINAITGGNTLDIGTHGFTAGAGVTFIVTTAGNPNGLTTGTVYFIDTVPSSTTITLRTNSVSGGAVTGLTNGTNLFITANTAAQFYDGTRNTANILLTAPRQGLNYFGTGVPPLLDSNRTNDSLGNIFLAGYRNSSVLNSQTLIGGRCTEDWTSATNLGSEIIFNTVKAGTGTVSTSTIGAGSSSFITDTFTVTNTAGSQMVQATSAGNLIIAGTVRVNGNQILASDGNTNITLTSNTLTTFAGDIRVNGNDIQASDGNNNITLTSNTLTTFAGDIQVNGNDIQASDANAVITFTPLGGSIKPNATFSGNIVKGVIRDATTLALGNMWSFSSGAGAASSNYVGLSIDNTNAPNAGNRTAIALRNSAASPSTALIMESSRGTVASPTATQNLDLLGFIGANGYNGTNWISDIVAATPGALNFQAIENFVSNTNAGVRFNVLAQPTATTLSTASRSTLIAHDAKSATYRADTWTFATRGLAAGGTNTTQMTMDGSGNMVITGTVRVNGNDIQNSAGLSTFTLTSGNTLTTIVGTTTRFQDASGNTQLSILPSGGSTLLNINKFDATTGMQFATINFNTTRSSGGTYTPTQNGDIIGQFKFNGNAVTGASPSVPAGPAAQITTAATENWSNTANGSKMTLSAIKQGTITSYDVISASPSSTTFISDAYTFNNTAGASVTSAAITYTRTYGEFAYTNAAGFAIPAQNTIYAMPLDTTLNNSGVTTSSTSRININVAGWYKVIMSLQASMTTNAVASFDFWLRKNGNDVANSKTQVDLLKDQKAVIAMDWLVNSNGSDYWEIVYASSATHYADIAFPTIAATATPGDPYTSPLAPALIVNVIPAGM